MGWRGNVATTVLRSVPHKNDPRFDNLVNPIRAREPRDSAPSSSLDPTEHGPALPEVAIGESIRNNPPHSSVYIFM